MESKSVATLLKIQSYVSAFLAVVIILSVTGLALWSITKGKPTNEIIPEVLSNWGGVIIGFYFGTSYAQITQLLKAAKPDSNSTG